LTLELTLLTGVSRSASVLIMYLIKTRGISYDEAFELVRVRRPLIKVLL
jgi:protein-tyrosine phosphatase